MLTDSRSILARLLREGGTIERVKGSHHVLRHAESPGAVVLPHPKEDLPIGTVRSIHRQAGWAPL